MTAAQFSSLPASTVLTTAIAGTGRGSSFGEWKMHTAALTDTVIIRIDRFRRWLPQLVAVVAQIGEIDMAELVGPRRTGWPVALRAAIILAAVDVMRKSKAEIARHLGGRNHGSIVTGYRNAQRRRANDPEFRQLSDLVIAVAREIAARPAPTVDAQPELQL